MTSEQIHSIAAGGRFPGPKTPTEVIETHISWVILTPAFAFKIKKPVRFSFLDFGTLEKRQIYCREELRLNRRLAPEMYLDVLPISLTKEGEPEICLANGGGTALDYAVAMKRMDNNRQMDRLLRQNAVTANDMETLAEMLAGFHRSVILKESETSYEASGNWEDFADLFRFEKVARQIFGEKTISQFEAWRSQVEQFLKKHEARLRERAAAGFWVEGHGDLHARNIFLLPESPVVFDCIEFSPHFRRLDVLNELAFLCMDLDANGHSELAEIFMTAYRRHWLCIESGEDKKLFLYFKAYRANVRLKIALVEWEQRPASDLEQTAKKYWTLLSRYLEQLA
jgi:hypothetical protein